MAMVQSCCRGRVGLGKMASGGNGLPCVGVRRTRAQQCRHRARWHVQWAVLGLAAAKGQGSGSHRCAAGLRARCRALMWLTTGAWGSGQWWQCKDWARLGRGTDSGLRKRCTLKARVTGRARHTAEVDGRNAGRGGGSQ